MYALILVAIKNYSIIKNDEQIIQPRDYIDHQNRKINFLLKTNCDFWTSVNNDFYNFMLLEFWKV